MMRNSTLFILFAFVAIFSFNSCKKDEFLDWKFMNKQWLAEHKHDKDFDITDSGVQYKITYHNEIKTPLPITSEKYRVRIIIEGHYITGEKDYFVPPTGRETNYSLRSLPKGLREVLRMMPIDADAEVRIPQELGYGDKKERGIPPYSTLIYKVRLKGATSEQNF